MEHEVTKLESQFIRNLIQILANARLGTVVFSGDGKFIPHHPYLDCVLAVEPQQYLRYKETEDGLYLAIAPLQDPVEDTLGGAVVSATFDKDDSYTAAKFILSRI